MFPDQRSAGVVYPAALWPLLTCVSDEFNAGKKRKTQHGQKGTQESISPLGLRSHMFSNFQVFEFSNFRVFEFSGLQIFEFSSFLVFKFSSLQVFEFPGFRVFKFSGSRISKF